MSLAFRLLAVVVVALAAATPRAHGHVLDEYLQATLVAIEPGEIRLYLHLTPGVEVAEQVLGQIDRNGDDEIARAEAEAYCESLRQDLKVLVDGREASLRLVASFVPEPDEVRAGTGLIQMTFEVGTGSFGSGVHTLTLENRHFATVGSYLLNAAHPRSSAIRIARQERNVNQSHGEIEFSYAPPIGTSRPSILAGVVGGALLLVGGLLLWKTGTFWPLTTAPKERMSC